MQIVLIATLVVLGLFTFEGVRHGVIRRAVEVTGLVAIFLFASRLADLLHPWLHETVGLSPRLAFFTSWVVVLIGGVIGVRTLARLISKALRFSVIGWLDRLGGATLGLAFGAVVTSLLLIALIASPVGGDFKNEVTRHPLTGRLLHVAPDVYDVARGMWGGDSFFEMLRQRVEPVARAASQGVKAFLDEGERGDDRDP